jgi:hypothetical protein
MGIKNNKKAAMEMSVGTIVTIILLVSVLVLGLILIQRIFSGATGAVDLGNDQLRNELGKLFSEDKRLVIYPGTPRVKMERGERSEIGIGIKNVERGVSSISEFSYRVEVADPDIKDNCDINVDEVENWMVGEADSNVPFPQGDQLGVERIAFDIPELAPLCVIKMRVTISTGDSTYATESFFLDIV